MTLDMLYEKLQGEYYGYPKCCINYYLKHAFVGKEAVWWDKLFKKYPRADRKIGQTGFIPCPSHLARISAGKIEIEDLIVNRLCPSPYPDDSLGHIYYEEISKG